MVIRFLSSEYAFENKHSLKTRYILDEKNYYFRYYIFLFVAVICIAERSFFLSNVAGFSYSKLKPGADLNNASEKGIKVLTGAPHKNLKNSSIAV
jgi:uncharacterized membrane protein YobD (UPF0266 family)